MLESLSYQIGRVKRKFVRQQAVNLLVNVDKEMACTIADNVGVDRPSGNNVPVSTSTLLLAYSVHRVTHIHKK
ncbi:hypothetical protein ACW2QC_03735 [Virgibacillus sp. FSP13]